MTTPTSPAPTQPDDELRARALTMLNRFYGYKAFRPMQADIILSALKGRDTIVLMPTGGGKSITFQIPAMMLPGVTVVVSPLLSLMRDQVEALVANGIPAAAINSLQSEAENRSVADALAAGHIKLLYMSPERLLADLPRWNSRINISLIAIDEAHCISRWGHDFRPDYTRLSEIRAARPDIPIMALTATADRLTRDDIAAQLRLRDPATFISSFDRPNLSLRVMPSPSARGRIDIIASLIDRYSADTGIVYCLARKTTESVAAELARRGYRVAHYHASTSADYRTRVQTAFRSGELQAVVATVAFGMGIDKSNVRWVVHNNMPSCIESYYQEIGRAGRDGLPSETLMFHSVADLISLRHFAEESGQAAINMEKLQRMNEYAEARICRRRILLSYFGETLDHDCGNCDVCLNPPQRFDATEPVKKALSAMIRTDEKVGVSMLIDILRGSARADLMARGYQHIKTYGAGRDIDPGMWQAIILQMLQLGFIDIAYDEGNRLRVTPYGRRILFASEPVMLARPELRVPKGGRRGRRQAAAAAAPVDTRAMVEAAVAAARAKIAEKEGGLAPYMVFSDATLKAIAASRPASFGAFAAIEGISERKAAKYWPAVSRAIAKADDAYKPEAVTTNDITLFYLRRGRTPVEIADIRGMKPYTIFQHLRTLAAADVLTPDDLRTAGVTSANYTDIVRGWESTDDPDAREKLFARYPDGMAMFMVELARTKGHLPPFNPQKQD